MHSHSWHRISKRRYQRLPLSSLTTVPRSAQGGWSPLLLPTPRSLMSVVMKGTMMMCMDVTWVPTREEEEGSSEGETEQQRVRGSWQSSQCTEGKKQTANVSGASHPPCTVTSCAPRMPAHGSAVWAFLNVSAADKKGIPELYGHVQRQVNIYLAHSVGAKIHLTTDTWSSKLGQGRYITFRAVLLHERMPCVTSAP